MRGQLPDCWTRPVPDMQPTLFSEPTEQALATLKVGRLDLHRWYAKGWISFEIDDLDELDWSRFHEIEFIKDVAHSGLHDGQIMTLLADLPRPYRFAPAKLAYHFRYGWVTPKPQEELYDVIDMHVEEWIEHLTEDENDGRLRQLAQCIAQHLEEIESVDELND